MQRSPGALDELSFPGVLASAQAGEAWGAETLFRDLQPRVLRFLRSTEPRAADDLAGEIWLAMAKGIRAFEGDLAGFRAWVFSIARRRLADHRRTAVRHATDPTDGEVFARRDALVDTAEQAIDGMSAQAAVDLITAHLPAEQAEVLVLRVVAELDVHHVAEVMGRNANWVRVTQHRALRRLADALKGAVGAGDIEEGGVVENMFRRNLPDPVIPLPPPAICPS
jgi:RNA polymerase sigma-70 factor (ECF subfamily)